MTTKTGNKTAARLYYLHALTPLHVGIGRGEGFIDLPLMREQSTNLPCVPGSAIKGVLRYEHTPPENDTSLSKEDIATRRRAANILFGKEPAGGEEASGLLRVGDARLLCLPVRSWQGVFAWATCPLILRRYRSDLLDAGETNIPAVPRIDKADVALAVDSKLIWNGDKIYLEDINLRVRNEPLAGTWANYLASQVFAGDTDWQQEFIERFVIVPDTLFAFLAKHATELRAHVKLNDNRTVKSGPWYEESLPAESLLWGLMGLDVFRWNSQKEATEVLWGGIHQAQRLQIGGSATVGLGQVNWVCPNRG